MESPWGTSASGSPCSCSPGLWPGRHGWEEHEQRSRVLAVCGEWGWGPGVARLSAHDLPKSVRLKSVAQPALPLYPTASLKHCLDQKPLAKLRPHSLAWNASESPAAPGAGHDPTAYAQMPH